jgi:DnaJ-class molecular chaperone
MARRSYYQILGISRSADADEVKRAFRERARTLHPDQRPDDPEAVEEFKAVAEAYAVLSEPGLRATYDRFGIAPAGAAFESTHLTPPSVARALKNVARAAARRMRARRGEDIRFDITIDFRAAAVGTRRVFELPRRGPDGAVRPRRLEFHLPPALTNSRVLRWPGEGAPGTDGGAYGDLLVRVAVERHPYFLRRDDDVVGHLPLTFVELLDGAHVQVPTLFGPRALEIPPRTEPGTELRLTGLGVPAEPPGDAVFVARLRFPDSGHEPIREAARSAYDGTSRDPLFDGCLLESHAWRRP